MKYNIISDDVPNILIYTVTAAMLIVFILLIALFIQRRNSRLNWFVYNYKTIFIY